MKTIRKKLIYVCIANLVCLTASAEELTFATNVRYKRPDENSFIELKSGEKLSLKQGDSLLITTSEGLPMLIYSTKSASSQIHIPNADLQSIMQEQLKSALEKSTQEIVEGLRRTEALIQKRDYAQALSTISPLKEKYKTISSVLFMSGTVHYLMNNKDLAIEELQQGLLLDPENIPAKNLLQKLGGHL